MNLYQHMKNQPISSICSAYTTDIKTLQSDMLKAFWSTSQQPDFSQIWDMCSNIAISVNFHYRTNSEKN